MEDAEALARSLVKTAQGAGCMASALITDMSQPLGSTAGNALEVIEVLDTLTGSSVNQALWDLTVALGGEALALGGLVPDAEQGEARIEDALESGRAAEVFGEMVSALGGPFDFVERYPDRLPAAPVVRDVPALQAGFVATIDGEALGHAVVHLGGGRLRGDDKINPSVGLSELMPLGEAVTRGEILARVHAATLADAERAVAAVQAAYGLAEQIPDELPLVLKRIG
jgi:thymidine phosphorylase